MKTYNDLGEVYFVECSNCGKHSTEVNDYWNDDDELFICDCGHPMFDGWEDEESKEGEKQNYITFRDYINLTDEDIWTTDAISCEFALIGKEAVCSKKTSSEATFFVPAETIPENLFNNEDSGKSTEEAANKKPMPERVRDYLTFEELSLELQNRIIRTDKLFCKKHGFQQDPSEIRNNLYHKDGSLACITRKEREDWYTSKEKSKTETVYRYKLSQEWCEAEIWGVSFEHALRRRGEITPNIPGTTTKNSLVINQIIETSKTDDLCTATVELEDGRIITVCGKIVASLKIK
jgi:hypothetical protein